MTKEVCKYCYKKPAVAPWPSAEDNLYCRECLDKLERKNKTNKELGLKLTTKQVFFRIAKLGADIHTLAVVAKKNPECGDEMMNRIIDLAEDLEYLYSTNWH